MYRIKAIFANVDLLKRIGITLGLLFIFRIMVWVPIPLIDTESISAFINGNDFFAILNNFTGDGLSRFSIMAMGITPYITASIVVQMLQMDIVPILKEWSEQGDAGKQKLNKTTRILGLALSFVQSLVLLLGLGVAGSEFIVDILSPTPILYIYMSLLVTAGTAFAMWLADLITRKGIGNGSSLLIVAGIITSLPSMMTQLWSKYIVSNVDTWTIMFFIGTVLVYAAAIVLLLKTKKSTNPLFWVITGVVALVPALVAAITNSFVNANFGGWTITLYVAILIAAVGTYLVITKKPFANLVVIFGLLATLPSIVDFLWHTANQVNVTLFFTIILIYLGVLLGVTYLELAKRRVPIQYSNRQANHGGRTGSDLPIKLNTSGVIPVIFASTILSIPLSISGMFGVTSSSALGSWFNQIFSYTQPIGFTLYVALILVFTFFYSFLMLNPETVANNLSKQNAYIPGVRPGLDTQNYLAKLQFKITLIGAVYLVILASIPIITSILFNFTSLEQRSIVLGGTSLLIVIGVALETTNQIRTDSESQEYKGIF